MPGPAISSSAGVSNAEQAGLVAIAQGQAGAAVAAEAVAEAQAGAAAAAALPLTPAQRAQLAEQPLGPGDLVIVTGNAPGKDEGVADARTHSEFADMGPRKGYMVSPMQPTTIDELTLAIKNAVAANGGVPFRRIIIISHAGGAANGPSLDLDPPPADNERLTYAAGRRTEALRLAIRSVVVARWDTCLRELRVLLGQGPSLPGTLVS